MGLDIYFSKRKSTEVGYFRKVNFLVNFFKKRGFDVENQTPLKILKEDAEDLLFYCNEVLKDHSNAPKLLPTMSGFFFGNTEYNDDYFEDVENVKKYLESTLIPEFENLENDETIYFETWF